MVNRGEGFTIRENITHTEYEPVKEEKKSNIPKAKFVYEGVIPIKLVTESRTYEVSAHKEVMSSKDFFEHTVEYYPRSREVETVRFKDENACQYVRELFTSYKQQHFKQFMSSMVDQLHLDTYDRPGGYSSTTKELLVDLEIAIRSDAFFDLAEPDLSFINKLKTLAMQIDAPIAEMIEQYKQYKRKPNQKGANANEINFAEDTFFSAERDEVLDWVKEIQEKNIPITYQITNVKTERRPIDIKRIIIGEIKAAEDTQFFVEELIAEKILFVIDTLKGFPRKKITVFDNTHMDVIEDEEWSWGAKTQTEWFKGNPASHREGIIFLHKFGDRVIDSSEVKGNIIEFNTHLGIHADSTIKVLNHEAGHATDPFIREATSPQKEGFAVSIEFGFVYKKVARKLRKNSDFAREISVDFLTKVLSSAPPSGLKPVEVYGVPATFYCYIFEKIGPENFMRFYSMLTGAEFSPKGKGYERLGQQLTHIKDELKYKGNMLNCLDALPKDAFSRWGSAGEFVVSYITDINNFGKYKSGDALSEIHTSEDEAE